MENRSDLSFDHIRIRQMREHRLLSQGQLAKCLGISQSSYNDLEQGRTKLRAEAIPILSKTFKVDVRCFFENHRTFDAQLTILKENENLLEKVYLLQNENENLNKLLSDNKSTYLFHQAQNEKIIESLERLLKAKKTIISGLIVGASIIGSLLLIHTLV